MGVLRERKGQGAFEYILLLAGVLLIVVLAIIILRGSVLATANNNIQAQANAISSQNNATIQFCGGYLGSKPSTVFVINGSNPNSSAHCFDPMVAFVPATGVGYFPDIIK